VQGSAHLLRFNHSIPCLDKSKSKKNAQNDKVFPFFLRSILFPSRTAGKRHEQMPQQNPKTPFFSTSFGKSFGSILIKSIEASVITSGSFTFTLSWSFCPWFL